MNRVVIFAHYDVHNTIQDYVIFCIQELQKIADKIIFISDTDMPKSELSKLPPPMTFALAKRHEEYDFGSYKRGFIYAKENGLLNDCEELVFINDSCYAPLFPFQDMFSKMSVKELDFWGNTINKQGLELKDGVVVPNNVEHIQSYFMVFKPNVFNSDVFNDFINSIKKEKTKEEVIQNYEVALTKLLADSGFKYDAYCELSKKIIDAHLYAYKSLVIKNKSPFVKRDIILYKKYEQLFPFFISYFINRHTKYKYLLIAKDRLSNSGKINIFKAIYYVLKNIRRKIIKIHFSERIVYLFEKKYVLRGKS